MKSVQEGYAYPPGGKTGVILSIPISTVDKEKCAVIYDVGMGSQQGTDIYYQVSVNASGQALDVIMNSANPSETSHSNLRVRWQVIEFY